jgi:hypothetical protein
MPEKAKGDMTVEGAGPKGDGAEASAAARRRATGTVTRSMRRSSGRAGRRRDLIEAGKESGASDAEE